MPSPSLPATNTTDGFILVDKPAGVSSHDVVLAVRRATGERRVGHAGTLDPFATGLLVVLIGRATRLARFLQDDPKVYDAAIRFGTETDTEDLSGAVVREMPLPERNALEAAAPQLIGVVQQVPPAYSAKHVEGKRAYQLARAGMDVDLAPVAVRVDELTLSSFEERDGRVTACRMRVSCGGGTYVRSLARDLARAAHTAGHLTALRRLRAGVFELGRSVAFEAVRDESRAPISPALDALAGYPVQPLSPEEVTLVSRGIDVEARIAGEHASLVDPGAPSSTAMLVAFGERRPSERGDRWQPRVVMREA